MPEFELEYPYNVFPTDILRRVLGTLPTWLSDDALAEVNAYHEDLWKDEPVPGPRYVTALSIPELTAKLSEDEHSIVHDVDGARDYSAQEIKDALDWHVEKGYVVYDPSTDKYSSTEAGREALSA